MMSTLHPIIFPINHPLLARNPIFTTQAPERVKALQAGCGCSLEHAGIFTRKLWKQIRNKLNREKQWVNDCLQGTTMDYGQFGIWPKNISFRAKLWLEKNTGIWRKPCQENLEFPQLRVRLTPDSPLLPHQLLKQHQCGDATRWFTGDL